jgi:hypothetical protein
LAEEIYIQCLGGELRCYDLIAVLKGAQTVSKWESDLWDVKAEARQISFSRNAASKDYLLLTLHLDDPDHEYKVLQLDNRGEVLNRKDGVRSAVYNSDQRTILVGTEFGFEVLDSTSFKVLTEI